MGEASGVRLRSRTDLLLPRRRPLAAPLGQMFALLQLLLPEVASDQGVAALAKAVGEVLASHAQAGTLAVFELRVSSKTPLLHHHRY